MDDFDDWKEAASSRSTNCRKAKDYDGVIKEGLAIRDLYPDYVEAGSVYEFLAAAYLAKDNKAAAIDQLERYVKAGGRDPGPHQATGQAARQRRAIRKEAAAVLERLNYIYPMDNDQHQMLGALWLDEGNAAGADSRVPRGGGAQPHRSGRRRTTIWRARYNLNHQPDAGQGRIAGGPGSRPRRTGRRKSYCWN